MLVPILCQCIVVSLLIIIIQQTGVLCRSKQEQKSELKQLANEVYQIRQEIEEPRVKKPGLVIEKTKITIMSLSDDIILNVLGYLNQIHVCRICTINSRFYNLGKIKSYRCMYFHIWSLTDIHISANTYTSFYTNFTVVNQWNTIPWVSENSNITLVKKMVFRMNGSVFEMVKSQCPWIEVTVEDANSKYHSYGSLQEYHYTELILSKKARVPFPDGCLEMPWARKLTIYLNFVPEQSLNDIKYLSGLEDLRINAGNTDDLEELCEIGLRDIPIKKLRISVLELIDMEELQEITEIFDLEKITTFQLHLWDENTYPESFNSGIQQLLSALVNVTSLSIICQNIDFEKVLESVKPNSLHKLHLKIVHVGNDIENFQLENLLNYQEHSLQRLYLSNKKQWDKTRMYGLQEFERIYKKETKPLVPYQ